MKNEIEIVASRFHAGLFFGHCIALWFNIRAKKYLHATIHAAFLAFDGLSALSHHKSSQDSSGRVE